MEQRKSPPWLEKKRISPLDLESTGRWIREQGARLATLNGSFDLLHAGHLYILYQASLQADRLLVFLNSDASIQRYKGSLRPLVPLEQRLEMVAALEFVDYVSWFEEDDPRGVLQKVKPDVHVNGEEYGQECIEAPILSQLGARLHLVERIPGLSTTAIIEKIIHT